MASSASTIRMEPNRFVAGAWGRSLAGGGIISILAACGANK